MFGGYKPTQVQLPGVDLHTSYCQDPYLRPPAGRIPLVAPAMEAGRHASASVTPDVLYSLAMFIANF